MVHEVSRRNFLKGAAAAGAVWAVVPRVAEALPDSEDGLWLAGDLHCHTVYSHDVWGGPDDDNTGMDEFYTLGWTAAEQIAIASSRGLDYLAITDHDDVRALTDPGYRSDNLVLVPGYEHSLSRGHAGCLGVYETFKHIDTQTDEGALELRDAIWAAGGLFILNHPFYGSGWRYSPAVRPDSIEVWNIGWPFRRELFPFITTSENYMSLPYWEEEFLSQGRMPATGGSDNHWRSTTAAQGVGQPTTWVYASERSWPAILEGIRAGRTTVSFGPPAYQSARLSLEAERGSERWMVGDTVRGSSPATFKVHALGAPGHLLRVSVDGIYGEEIPVITHDYTYELALEPAQHNRIRAELYADAGYWMAALTSPIYMGA